MATSQAEKFERVALEEPYDFVDSDLLSEYLERVEIMPIDAEKSDDVKSDMTWGQSHIGGGGPLTITDYGRHREECDTLKDFIDMVRKKMQESPGTQYLKFMNDDKSEVADTLVAITKSDGYVVLPYFE